jgi:3-dehydroquinate synthase
MSRDRIIHVVLPSGDNYDIRIGSGALSAFCATVRDLKDCERALVISDENVGPAYGKLVKKRLEEAGFAVSDLLVAPGENSKSLALAGELWETISQYGFTRDDLIVACGGGVVGDLAGFVASTYMRGVDFIQVPTTLLAMVDSSIGGKTAVNLASGKNLVGTFHQPIFVCSDIRCLKTLLPEDWANGFAEIAKSAFVAPRRSFYEWLRTNADGLMEHDAELLEEIVYMTAQFKASVVASDTTESAGKRECLNYGHTLAHAIENAAGYGTIAHGRAVAEGMRFSARLSVEVLGCDISVVKATDAILDRLGLPAIPWTSQPERLFNLIKGDKKARGGHARFVLLNDIASWELCTVPDETVMEHLKAWCAAKERLIQKNDGKMWGQQ